MAEELREIDKVHTIESEKDLGSLVGSNVAFRGSHARYMGLTQLNTMGVPNEVHSFVQSNETGTRFTVYIPKGNVKSVRGYIECFDEEAPYFVTHDTGRDPIVDNHLKNCIKGTMFGGAE